MTTTTTNVVISFASYVYFRLKIFTVYHSRVGNSRIEIKRRCNSPAFVSFPLLRFLCFSC
nr:MAG TPA: hypothetical protein [Caudoviricetes sp.]